MMKKSTILTLAAIVLFLAVGFYVLNFDRTAPQHNTTQSVSTPLPRFIYKEIDRIVIKRQKWEHGVYQDETSTLEKRPEGWSLTSPVEYPANPRLIHEILNVLCNLKPIPLENVSETDETQWQLTVPWGIDVTVHTPSSSSHLIVGANRQRMTYLRFGDMKTVYQAAGHLRKVFNRSPSQLRSHTITDFDNRSVTRMTFHNEKQDFTIVKNSETSQDKFVPDGIEIRNFDTIRAAQKAASLAHLNARDFHDRPYRHKDDDKHRVTVSATQSGVPVTAELIFGARDPNTGLYYLTTSLSKQVFLVSGHFKGLFTATPDDFERTDEEVAEYLEWRKKADTHLKEHEHRRHAFLKDKRRSDDNGSGTDPHLENHVQ